MSDIRCRVDLRNLWDSLYLIWIDHQSAGRLVFFLQFLAVGTMAEASGHIIGGDIDYTGSPRMQPGDTSR
ncbi:MAG: hypothetical protein V8T87_13785 [Victivallales bacterium]